MATVRLPSGNILEVHDALYDFVRDEAVAGTAAAPAAPVMQ